MIYSNVESKRELEIKAHAEQIRRWHDEGLDVASQWRRSEFRLVELLSYISRTRGYYLYQCESLSSYARHCWQLPEHAVRDLVTVANKAIEIPEMLEALKSGRVTVSKLRKICSVITPEDQAEWIELVANCTSREVEKAVAMRNPSSQVFEKMIYKSGSLVELTVGISEDLMHKIQRVQDLLASKKRESATIAESLEFVVNQALEKLDPIEKAKRALKRSADRRTKASSLNRPEAAGFSNLENSESAFKNSEPAVRDSDESNNSCATQQSCVTGRTDNLNSDHSATIAGGRTRLTAEVRHEVALRDQAQCAHITANGSRCLNRRWLHVHHKREIARGGGNELENLTTLCSGHHRIHHNIH
jgi:hypothetical protein